MVKHDLKWLIHLTEVEYRGHSFNGYSLMETVRRLTLDQVLSKKTHQSFTVWGLVLHCAYFKWKMTLFLRPDVPIDFPYEQTEFPALPEDRSGDAWRESLLVSDRIHDAYIEVLRTVKGDYDRSVIQEWDCGFGEAIAWIATHDTYHNAQIRNMGLKGL